jgi:predicted Zn-dependent protease
MFKKVPAVFFFLFLLDIIAAVSPVMAGGQSDLKSGNSSDFGTLTGDMAGAFAQMEQALKPSVFEMSPEDEYYLGRSVAAEIIKVYKPYTRDPVLTEYLNKICLAITINSAQPTLYNGYHVEILDTAEICAFATPGGHILISLGLIACAPSEDALAAVTAHEVAHTQLRHVAAILQQDRTIQELDAIAGRAASIAARNLASEDRTALFRESMNKTVNTLLRNGYSMTQEFEADKTARQLLIGAGYDPAGLSEMLRVLDKQPKTGNMSATHPAPLARVANLGAEMGSMGRDTRSSRTARFGFILSRLPRE